MSQLVVVHRKNGTSKTLVLRKSREDENGVYFCFGVPNELLISCEDAVIYMHEIRFIEFLGQYEEKED